MSAPPVTPTLQRRAGQATRAPKRVCTTHAFRIDKDVRHAADRRTRQSSAPGIAEVTAQREAEPRDEHRRDVPERWRHGRDQAAPVERVGIETEDGGQRPSGQPACEDKMVQRAVAMRLAAIDEPDVRDGASGVRPGRSPPQARHA